MQKAKPSTLKDGFYSTDIHSFTKNKTSTVIVSEEFLGPEDKVLIIDDFLANGDASLGLYDIAQQAKAETVGVGIVVEKVSRWTTKIGRGWFNCFFIM